MAETYFAHAYEKGIDSQPRKTNIVASLVRDRYVADAVVILEHTPRRAARAVLKAVESANANLLNNSKVSIDPKTIRIAENDVCRVAGNDLEGQKGKKRDDQHGQQHHP